MSDKTDIGFVYAHTKGDGCDDNDLLIAQKPLLVVLPNAGAQTRMVGQRAKTLLAKPVSGGLDFFTR